MAEVPTIEIPETQVAEDSQGDQGQDANTQMYTDSMMNNNGTEQKDDQHWQDAQSQETFNGNIQPGQGEVSQEEPQEGPTQVVPTEDQDPEVSQLVRQGAFLEEEDNVMITCKKCGCNCDPSECIIRNPSESWCKQCNSLYTMLQRHMAWPPKEFQALSGEQQMNFFLKCAQEKAASGKSQFSYSRVRENLTKVLVDEEVRATKLEVGGTYWPKSVYEAKGYELDSDFESRVPRQWSYSLNCWTYLLCETTIHETHLKQTVERSVLQAEQAVKKRRRPEALAPAEAEALEQKSTVSDATMVLDLLSESGSEDGAGAAFFFNNSTDCGILAPFPNTVLNLLP